MGRRKRREGAREEGREGRKERVNGKREAKVEGKKKEGEQKGLSGIWKVEGKVGRSEGR